MSQEVEERHFACLNAVVRRTVLENVPCHFQSLVCRYAAKQAGLLAVALARAAAAGEKNTNGIAVIRPPGHHIEANQCLGFGLFNNIAVAARMAQRAVPGTRVMIVDWDIHHGNGTQDIFHDDPSVLFVSIHGYLGGKFFPKGEAGSPSKVGSGAGEGFNLNVGWDQLGREDCDYLAAFNEVSGCDQHFGRPVENTE